MCSLQHSGYITQSSLGDRLELPLNVFMFPSSSCSLLHAILNPSLQKVIVNVQSKQRRSIFEVGCGFVVRATFWTLHNRGPSQSRRSSFIFGGTSLVNRDRVWSHESHKFKISLEQKMMLPELLRIELEPRMKVFDHTNFDCPKRHRKIVIHEHWAPITLYTHILNASLQNFPRLPVASTCMFSDLDPRIS